jgi:hypothetical protein
MPAGIVTERLAPEDLRAYSTYLHETIHWWQHVGSTVGFLMSLSYPAQAHANSAHLQKLLELVGPKKSIRRLIDTLSGGGGPETRTGLANIIVNNYFDIDFFRILVTDPASVPKIIENPLFSWEGHCYHIAYANVISLLARSVDRNFSALPDPRGWGTEFAKLAASKQRGYFLGSDLRVAPIGTRQIFEGQARFAQLQYLHFASRGSLSWGDFSARGMLTEMYVSAFKTFLDLSHLEWPPAVDHPTVALFLLVCEIAINPGAGFPMPLQFFSAFINDVNPGMRFIFLCSTIAKGRSRFEKAITHYSRDEYAEVSEVLTRELILDSPLDIANRVSKWAEDGEGFASLASAYLTFEFPPENLPVSLMLAHFMAFNADKQSRPEFFCWPGAWMAGERVSPEVGVLFDRHSALFVDKADDDGVFPRILTGRDEQAVQKAFDVFYAFAVTYDMTRQWIAAPGPFVYEYRWMSSSATQADFKRYADGGFERVYGVRPDSFELL